MACPCANFFSSISCCGVVFKLGDLCESCIVSASFYYPRLDGARGTLLISFQSMHQEDLMHKFSLNASRLLLFRPGGQWWDDEALSKLGTKHASAQSREANWQSWPAIVYVYIPAVKSAIYTYTTIWPRQSWPPNSRNGWRPWSILLQTRSIPLLAKWLLTIGGRQARGVRILKKLPARSSTLPHFF